MKKSKGLSQVSVKSSLSSARFDKEIKDVELPPLDTLTVKVLSLRLPCEDLKHYAVKVTFFDQLLISGIIVPIDVRDVTKESTQITGTFNYDPSDYEKMCLFADSPLVVSIQPLANLGTPYFIGCNSPAMSDPLTISKTDFSKENKYNDDTAISCCNIDILPIFVDKDKLCVRKRMQPMIKPSVLNMKSWDNLPLLTLELIATRNPENTKHHLILEAANFMKVTVLAAYNLLIPYDSGLSYTAASKIPLSNDTNTGIVTYSKGCRKSKTFDPVKLYPGWESLKLNDNVFIDGDEKLVYDINQLQNDFNIDLKHYFYESSTNTTVWSSFHRTLILENSDVRLFKHLRHYNWPVEVHIQGERGGYSFMTYLDLFRLLYPGEYKVCLAVPLYWIDPDLMMNKCNCENLLPVFEKAPSTSIGQKRSKDAPESFATSSKSDMYYERPTGADGTNAFVIVEVKLGHSLKEPVLPPHIPNLEIQNMLKDMEHGTIKKKCTGRGQLEKEWQSTIRAAASSLKKVPQYGMTEFCAFHRQLSETRTRVELSTSFWQEAAIYVNNNFTTQCYLQSDGMFEEMLIMSHTCLMKIACVTLVGIENTQDLDPVIKAARHARQMQDIIHAKDLFFQVVAERRYDANSWRELATCLKDYDKDWAAACIDESMELNPRHALTLLSKGSMVYEKDPEAAEPFFIALLSWHPFWSVGWTITAAYYLSRNYFYMADQVLHCMRRTKAEGLLDAIGLPRAWERELRDWWDHTPLLPGMNHYFDAADILLRLRAMTLAEICIARALSESGESAAYVHLLSLCCRLRGQVNNALCHLRKGLQTFGEISYLRNLEAECLHKKKECAAAIASLEKAGNCVGPFSILLSLPIREPPRARSVLVDLIRRHPSAYAWMALADDWMMRSVTGEGGDGNLTEEQSVALTCAGACAVQALKWDRRAARAWALLARLLKPRARRDYCRSMAVACGYIWSDEGKEKLDSQSLCNTVGIPLLECRCKCEHMTV